MKNATADARELSNAAVVRRLLGVSWGYRWACVRILLLQLVLLALGLAGLRLSGLAIDHIRHHSDPVLAAPRWPVWFTPAPEWGALGVLAAVAGAVLVLAGLRAALNFVHGVALARLVHGDIVVRLRAEVYDKLQRLSFRFFDATESGSIINRITADVHAVRMFVDQILMQVVIMVLTLAVYVTYMASLSGRLTLACLVLAPLIAVASTWFSRRVKPLYERNRELMDGLVLFLSERVQGIAVVKGFAREGRERAEFDRRNTEVRDQQGAMFWKLSLFVPAISMLSSSSLVILLLYGGWMVIRGELPLGSGLIVFTGLLQQFGAQVQNIATVANSAQQCLTGSRRVFEILDTPVEVENPPDPMPLGRARGAVEFDGVRFGFTGAGAVLHGVSFSARPGERIGVFGPTGAGKSALLSLIPRFYDPQSGCVRFDGVDVRKLGLNDLRRNIGLVFQESFLFSHTVAANIAFGHPDAGREAVERAAAIAAADGFIRALPEGYDTLLGEGAKNLSGGQRQRLAIARAVLLDPAVLLLDDPTAAVDPETEGEILAALDSAMRGRTVFLVSHRVSALRRCDRILVLEAGRIVQEGTHAELVAREGLYRRVAELQGAG
jgi:ATP-binding cassette subfamily B protein